MARDPRLPYRHGFTPATVADARGIIPKPQLRLDGYKSLGELTGDYAFFTPAVLYLSGFFADSILIDYMAELGQDVTFYHYRFRSPIFRGLVSRSGDLAWNEALWAVERQHWPSLQDFLCSVTVSQREQKLVVGIGYQEFAVLDPLAIERQKVIADAVPRISVGAFGINSNKFVLCFNHGDPLTSLPTATRTDPAPNMDAFASALFAARNPNDARLDHDEASRRTKEKPGG